MTLVAVPEVDSEQLVEDGICDQVRALFGSDFAVVIMDSDFTTFEEVENACISLFSYTRPEAEALALRVHKSGEALAAILAEPDARRAVRQLRARNVLSRVERA